MEELIVGIVGLLFFIMGIIILIKCDVEEDVGKMLASIILIAIGIILDSAYVTYLFP